jgi:hypothetical protein
MKGRLSADVHWLMEHGPAQDSVLHSFLWKTACFSAFM